jgi:hypothetical protein
MPDMRDVTSRRVHVAPRTSASCTTQPRLTLPETTHFALTFINFKDQTNTRRTFSCRRQLDWRSSVGVLITVRITCWLLRCFAVRPEPHQHTHRYQKMLLSSQTTVGKFTNHAVTMRFSDYSRIWHRLQWHLPFVWVVTLAAMTTTVTRLCSRWGTRFWSKNFLGAFAKPFQKVIISFIMSVRPPMRMEQFGSRDRFRRGVAEAFALLGCYAAYVRSCLLTFRDGL